MLTVGDRIPQFDLQAVVALEQDRAFARITDQSKEPWISLAVSLRSVA